MSYRDDRVVLRQRAEQLDQDVRALEAKLAQHEAKDVRDEEQLATLKAEVARLKKLAREHDEAPGSTRKAPSRTRFAMELFSAGMLLMLFIAAFGAVGYFSSSDMTPFAVVGVVAVITGLLASAAAKVFLVPVIMGGIMGGVLGNAAHDSALLRRQGEIPKVSVTQIANHDDALIKLTGGVLGSAYGTHEFLCRKKTKSKCSADVRAIIEKKDHTASSAKALKATKPPGTAPTIYGWLEVRTYSSPEVGRPIGLIKRLNADNSQGFEKRMLAIDNACDATPPAWLVESGNARIHACDSTPGGAKAAKQLPLFETFSRKPHKNWFEGPVETAFLVGVVLWLLTVLIGMLSGTKSWDALEPF